MTTNQHEIDGTTIDNPFDHAEGRTFGPQHLEALGQLAAATTSSTAYSWDYVDSLSGRAQVPFGD